MRTNLQSRANGEDLVISGDSASSHVEINNRTGDLGV